MESRSFQPLTSSKKMRTSISILLILIACLIAFEPAAADSREKGGKKRSKAIDKLDYPDTRTKNLRRTGADEHEYKRVNKYKKDLSEEEVDDAQGGDDDFRWNRNFKKHTRNVYDEAEGRDQKNFKNFKVKGKYKEESPKIKKNSHSRENVDREKGKKYTKKLNEQRQARRNVLEDSSSEDSQDNERAQLKIDTNKRAVRTKDKGRALDGQSGSSENLTDEDSLITTEETKETDEDNSEDEDTDESFDCDSLDDSCDVTY